MDKVISSNITRSFNKSNDELYELLKVVPAVPAPEKPLKSNSCNFQPRNDKQYMPKKKNRHKVITVRDIRNDYEKYILNELPVELEKQQSYILRKIKSGATREPKTKSIAKNMINGDKPLTKITWQMLMNINPEGCTHSMQYVLWNGKSIRINGSKGGKNKFICKYDLGNNKDSLKNMSIFKRKTNCKKKGLLQNSLSVNFKPGPLTRKKFLDNSYQKYHVGDIDVINLPKPGLEIQSSYGSALEPTISSFVSKLRNENGVITEKWAEFAVSVLGIANGSNISQLTQGSAVTFNLSYKHEQTRLLMRRDLENKCEIKKINDSSKISDSQNANELNLMEEVRVIMEGLLDAVEININQDNMHIEDDEIREVQPTVHVQNNVKEKNKRRYCELDRLDVTVIRLTENETVAGSVPTCNNSYCALGCICSSLQSAINLKGHCGRVDCMFECKCEFSKYEMDDPLCSDRPELLPGLYNLNNEINSTLAKEEQKFHQTVIVSGDKSILLKSKKRNCKSSKKYADFYDNLCLKPKPKAKPILAIVEPKLNCDNIEPWCMVHNLYKCFCKGRFVETTSSEINLTDANESINEVVYDLTNDDVETLGDREDAKYPFIHSAYQTRKGREKYNDKYESDSCARIKPYGGRKYSDGYYIAAYSKIKEMEVNDTKLRKKLDSLINDSGNNTKPTNDNICVNTNSNVKEKKLEEVQEIENTSIQIFDSDSVSNKSHITVVDGSFIGNSKSNRPKLVAWLEANYQQYKRRLDMGISKTTLEPPKQGKMALYPWEFILKRYNERKNMFLVSKHAPHRIFMAVRADSPLFENCINIDDIRFAELNKYPTTVKNLLTSTSTMKDYFCILYGYNHCWEFIGTVAKVNDQKDSDDETSEKSQENEEGSTTKSPNLLLNIDDEASITFSSDIQQMSPILENTRKQSKWFIMTIENDFIEMQFYNRGFFVKLTSIIKAIDVARLSGKTVRLTSRTCTNENNDITQYGIYAIPNANKYCVFIGPYEIHEPLGFETIKTVTNVKKNKRTRGVWITTDKVDNLKVIDNPLSFIPAQESEYSDIVSLENKRNKVAPNSETTQKEKIVQKEQDVAENKPVKEIRVVKPIKISKSNGFYHLTSNTLLKNYLKSPNKLSEGTVQPTTLILKPTPNSTNLTLVPQVSDALTAIATPVLFCASNSQSITLATAPVNKVQNRPVAEVAPQIKIAAVYSEYDPEKSVERKRKEGGMFILKPEEINERLVIDGNKSPKAGSSKLADNENPDIAIKIENSLETSNVCPAPVTETFVISDDEDDPPHKNDDEPNVVFIECVNVENLGVLRGEVHPEKGIRFEFPGFKISDYYKPEEVFTKINQVLSRRVYIPKNLNMKWRIVESMSVAKNQRLLRKELFGPNLIMTRQGIKTKKSPSITQFSNIKTYLKNNKKTSSSQGSSVAKTASDNQIGNSSNNFEKESLSLEEESYDVLSETVAKKEDIMKSIAEASDVERHEFTSVLKDIEIMSTNED